MTMKENKKVKNQPTQRLRYEAPQVWCIPIETEGIMASSKTVGFTGGTGGDNAIQDQTGENFFGGDNYANDQTGDTFF